MGVASVICPSWDRTVDARPVTARPAYRKSGIHRRRRRASVQRGPAKGANMAVTTRPRVREEGLAEAIGLGPDELATRKRFLEFDDGDVRRLEGMSDLAQESVDAVIAAFYEHLLSFPETAAFFHDPEVLEFARHREKEYFIRLMQGDYEQEYVEDRLQLGTVHEKIGLPIRLFLGMYAFYLRQIAPRILDQHSGEPAEAFEAFHSLTKLL